MFDRARGRYRRPSVLNLSLYLFASYKDIRDARISLVHTSGY